MTCLRSELSSAHLGGWSPDSYRLLATTGGSNTLSVTVGQAATNSLRLAVDPAQVAIVVR